MDRNSFVFYKEWMEAIGDLSDDIRLEIYESIIVYATSGDLPVLKPMAKIAFNFIKTTIDRDAERYMSIKDKKSESGSLGNLKRWHKDLHAKVLSGEMSAEEANNIAKHRSATKGVANIANIAVNVSDSVSVNTKKESAKADEKERATDVATLSPDYLKFLDWMKRKAPFCNNPKNFTHGITEDEFYTLKEKYSGKELADIIEQIENRKDLRKRYTNLYRTVLNWIKKEKQ